MESTCQSSRKGKASTDNDSVAGSARSFLSGLLSQSRGINSMTRLVKSQIEKKKHGHQAFDPCEETAEKRKKKSKTKGHKKDEAKKTKFKNKAKHKKRKSKEKRRAVALQESTDAQEVENSGYVLMDQEEFSADVVSSRHFNRDRRNSAAHSTVTANFVDQESPDGEEAKIQSRQYVVHRGCDVSELSPLDQKYQIHPYAVHRLGSDFSEITRELDHSPGSRRRYVVQRECDTSEITTDSNLRAPSRVRQLGQVSAPVEFDKWEALVEMDPRQQSGDRDEKRNWEVSSGDFLTLSPRQAEDESPSEIDKWEKFPEEFVDTKGRPYDSDVLAEKWRMCFETDSESTPEISNHSRGQQDANETGVEREPEISLTGIFRGIAVFPIDSSSGSVEDHTRHTSVSAPSLDMGCSAPKSPLTFRSPNDRAHELLTMYLESIGADPAVARDIARTISQRSGLGRTSARSLVKSDEHVEELSSSSMLMAEYYNLVNYAKVAMELREYDKIELGWYDKELHPDVANVGDGTNGSARMELDDSEDSTASQASSGCIAGSTSTAANRNRRHVWHRFENPGDVQMEGRFFEAPIRESPCEDIESPPLPADESSHEVVLEATAVDDGNDAPSQRSKGPVVCAEKVSFASWAREHFCFRRMIIVFILVVAATITVVLAFQLTRN